MKKFLVVRTDRIGDLLLSTPVIYEIKRKIESSFVAVLTNNYAKEILFNNSDVDLIYSIDDKNVYKNIKMQNFDTAIVLYPRFLISLKILLCGIPERIGTAFRWYSPLFFNKKIKLHRKNSGMHEADLNLLMIKDIIGETKAKKLYYYPMEAERIRADEYLVKNNIKEFIMIFIGGRGSADNLSPEKYADIASAIKEKFNKKIIIGYGLDEYDKIKRFKLDRLFDHILIEGELGYGKPDKRVFLKALELLDVLPHYVWMIGDDLERDIAGAQHLGIYSIWVDWRKTGLPRYTSIRPDKTIHSISELSEHDYINKSK